MEMKSVVLVAGSAALSALMACSIRLPGGPRPAPQDRAGDESSGTGGLDPVAAARGAVARADCPSDLTVATDGRKLDTRKAGDMEPDRYKRMSWAPGHRKSPAPDFFLSDRAAVDQVIALETKHPDIVPAGFRSQLRANPRDRGLRLRMARCELEAATTRRRASYDAAMSLLLGSPLEEVEQVLLQSTKFGEGDRTVASCAVYPCSGGMVCEPVQKHCLKPEAVALGFVSEAELAIEEALSRALYPRYLKGDRGWDSTLGWFLAERAHTCGGQLCRFAAYSKDGSTDLVRWDIRDGGTVEIHPCKETPAMLKSVASQRRCRAETGSWSQNLCLSMCRIYQHDSESCRVPCYQHCETEATLHFECITDASPAR